MLLLATLLFNTCHTIKTMWAILFHIRTDQKLLVKQHMVQGRLNGLAIMSTERILALDVDTEHCYKPHETHFLKRWATAFFQRDLDLLIGCCANLLEVIPMLLLVFVQGCCEKQQYFYKLTPRCELWFTIMQLCSSYYLMCFPQKQYCSSMAQYSSFINPSYFLGEKTHFLDTNLPFRCTVCVCICLRHDIHILFVLK